MMSVASPADEASLAKINGNEVSLSVDTGIETESSSSNNEDDNLKKMGCEY
jgi:hypothetical protein